MAKFLRKKITGNIYVDEATSGVFKYKYADTVETGFEEAHLVGDVNTQAEAETKWGLIADDTTLATYKQSKFLEIDIRTGELISAGFEYPASSGKIFSLSKNAQINLLGVDIKRNDVLLPITFNTIDDLDDVELVIPQDVDDFFMTALGTKSMS